MQMTYIKKLYIAIVFSVIAVPFVNAFSWPQDGVLSSTFYSYFAQFRGGSINKSLVFNDAANVTAADSGKIICVMYDHDEDMGWFNSTLGNAVIIAHSGGLLSVYANLDDNSFPDNIESQDTVAEGEFLGASGSSGWTEGQSCLEFQILDTKQKTVINPRCLMPRIDKEIKLTAGSMVAVNKNGTEFDFASTQTLPSGRYRIYRQRQQIAMPYRTTLSVNGTVEETINYNLLKQEHNRLCVIGKSAYPVEIVFPDEKKNLIGDITITRGRNIISVVIEDILGNAATGSYSINAQ